MEFDINDLTGIGVVSDTPDYMLPPEAFTIGRNVRCVDGGMERLLGWDLFTTCLQQPSFVMPVTTPSVHLWIYMSLTNGFVFDGTTHSNITRTGQYNTVNSQDWNGTLLANIPILNNGVDVPQAWMTSTPATKLVDLQFWPATLRAKVIRAFGPFLVAIHCTDNGAIKPHLVKWSHPASPGQVPPSWNHADPTQDAGENDLPDVYSGLLRDAMPLGGTMFLYKDSSTWKMRFVGGRFIFDFGEGAWLTSVGILAPRCVCVTGDGLRQVVVTQDDIIWHNGNTVRSILDKRLKKRLFNELDPTNFQTSFLFANPAYNEVWFCYPTAGHLQPNQALILNYGEAKEDRWTVTEADGITFRHASVGGVQLSGTEPWDNPAGFTPPANLPWVDNTWDDDDGPWSELLRRRVILACTDATTPTNNSDQQRLFILDRGGLKYLTNFSATLQRTGIALVGKKRNGETIVDHQLMKMLTRLWPKMQGGPVTMRFGAQQTVDGPVRWGPSVTFDPVTQTYADPGPVSGRAVGWELTSTSSKSWRLDGYKIDMHNLGNY